MDDLSAIMSAMEKDNQSLPPHQQVSIFSLYISEDLWKNKISDTLSPQDRQS